MHRCTYGVEVRVSQDENAFLNLLCKGSGNQAERQE